jgi:hypothetical protein
LDPKALPQHPSETCFKPSIKQKKGYGVLATLYPFHFPSVKQENLNQVMIARFFSILFFTVILASNCFGQLEKTIHQTFDIGEKTAISLDLFGEYTLEHWAGNNILVETNVQLFNSTSSVLKHFIEKDFRYQIDMDTLNETSLHLVSHDKKRISLRTKTGAESTEAVILATGHSARDIYRLLHHKGIKIEAKPFALGVRIEHPQPLIDKIQYGQEFRDEHLPASSYKLACQVEDRGVFSFCMCPGGLVVPAATSPGEIVVNGMSMSRRDSPYANSGTVVQVELEDLGGFSNHGVFSTLEFQASVEQTMFRAGDGSQKAPAQRLTDFAKGKVSAALPGSSYIPGLFSAPLHELLPNFIYDKLKKGVLDFGRKMRGYFTEEANVIATESRTSSPVRIPRNKETYMHVEISGLFPAGEGAGYAGGIISAAMDGQNVARAVGTFLD